MPTSKPRLTITLSEKLAWQLQQLSKLTGQSQGGLIASLLEGSDLVFNRLIATLEAAEQARASVPGRLTSTMREAQERIEQAMGFTDAERFSEAPPVVRRARKAAPADGRGPASRGRNQAAAAASGSGDKPHATPLSNRGGRTERQTTKSSTRSRG